MSYRRGSSPGREAGRSRFVFLLSMFAIVASLLMPVLTLTASDAAAQGVPPDCDPGFVVSDDQTTCVPDPDQSVTETSVATDTATATETQTQTQVDPTFVYIDKFDCPTDTDWSMVNDLGTFLQSCGPNQTPVTMTVNGEPQQIAASGQWGPYQDLASVPMSEGINPNYNLPHWFCGTFTNGGQPSLSDLGASASVTQNVAPGESISCQVFNTQQPTDQFGTVMLHTFACPDGATFGDPTQATIDQLQQECQQPLGGVNFDYEQNGQSVQQLVTDQSGMAQWDQAPVGDYALREQLPFGYGFAVVHCSSHEANQGNFVGQSSPVQMNDASSWSATMEAGFVNDCYVFNIPTDQLQLTKHWCAPDFAAPDNATEQDYQGCAEMPGAQITWRVALQAGDQDITSLQPDATTGYAGYGALQQDQALTVLEQLPDGSGYGAPAVFCAEYQRGGTGQPSGMVSYDPSTGVAWTPRTGFFLVCDFYNVAESGVGVQAVNNQITLYKWQCDPGTMTGQPLDYYQGGQENQDTGPCETEHMDVPFTVTDANGPQPKTTVHNTTWDGLVVPDQGQITIQETIQPPYGEPMVWCWYNDDDPQPMTTANGLLTLPAAPDEPWTFSCNWYNIPTGEGTGTIVIEKYWCPQGLAFVQTPTRADMMGACQEQPTDGATFSLTGPTASPQTWPDMQPTGGPPQSFTWSDLPAGEYTVTESGLGAGWTSSVYCHASNGQENGSTDDENLAGPSVTRMLDAGYTIDCAWFNQPGETNDNSVTIYKWQCDPGTEYGQGQEYYQGGLPDQETGPCETVHGGVPVHLIDGSPDSPHDDVTSHNTPSWSGVVLDANGSFQVQVDEPAGFGTPMVFCRTLDDEQSTAVDATGGLITITPAGEPFAYQCDWYNIPAGEYQLELYKYSCDSSVDRNLGLPDLGSNPNCQPSNGVSFTAQFGSTPGSASYTDASGYINWTGVEGGPWTLTEGMRQGYDAPKVFCGPPQSGETPEVPVSTAWTVTGTLDSTSPHTICYWFNFEQPPTNGHITVHKFQCPPGTTVTDFGQLTETCTTPHNGIGFNLRGNGVDNSASTVAGSVDWLDLDNGTYTVTETTVLPGYEAPIVWCGNAMQDGVEIDPGSIAWANQPVSNGAIQLSIDNTPQWIVCNWYNIPSDYGEITIYKWTCAAGYDLSAWGADPKKDCRQATNGVTFTLTPSVGQTLQTNTGDSIPGAVYFGGLNPGSYRVTETVPPNTQSVFVLDCTGTHLPKVHQVPLSWGNKLDINVSGGDKIVCQWYNVPRPKTGAVMVHKYVCSTRTFIDKVYCVTYERGQAFELFQVNGNVSKGVGITNAGGTYLWKDLQPGSYSIREDKGVPCKMTASAVDGKGNAWINAGQTTVINVYNCAATPGKVPPGKPPVKYPNTGVGPDASDSLMPANLPALQGEPASTPSAEEEAASEAFYQVDCISGEVTPGAPAASTPEADATMPPIEAEPTEAPADTETSASPPATPEVGEGECQRGAVPTHITIGSIGVDANIEYLEIVDGLMEQPTGAADVAWYKDTARLGETNNVVMAGHLNWWNVPEGVFYRLQDMQEGDRIEVTGDDGQVYIYEVRSVTQESNLEPPGIDVIGPADEPTLTLITCGGDWNADVAEYDQRTVVRAVQVDVQPAAEAGS